MKTIQNNVDVEFTYMLQPPNIWTFKQPRLKIWCEKWCKGKVLNLFAGKVKMDVDEYRVDISKEFNPNIVCDAQKFIETTKLKFDTIIFDPPYNWRKARESYKGNYIGNERKLKDILSRVLNKNGRVISFGYDSTGMAKSRGFKKIAICLVCHNGNHHDTICLVEEKEQTNLLF